MTAVAMDWRKVTVESVTVAWTEELKLYLIGMYEEGLSQSVMAERVSKRVDVDFSSSAIAGALGRLRRQGRIGSVKSPPVESQRQRQGQRQSAARRSNLSGRVANRAPHPKPVRRTVSIKRSYAQNAAIAKEARKNYGRSASSFDPALECSIDDLNDARCRWPLGTIDSVPPYRYCGCPTRTPSPYCARHLETATDLSKGYRRKYDDDGDVE